MLGDEQRVNWGRISLRFIERPNSPLQMPDHRGINDHFAQFDAKVRGYSARIRQIGWRPIEPGLSIKADAVAERIRGWVGLAHRRDDGARVHATGYERTDRHVADHQSV